jgi:hypothetical protein
LLPVFASHAFFLSALLVETREFVWYSVVHCSVMATLAVAIVRISIAVLWIVAPPVFIALALFEWKRVRKTGASGVRAVWPAAVALAVLANWILFLALVAAGQIGGFGTHYITTRLADWFLLLSLLLFVGSIGANVAKGKLSLASLLVLALWAGSELVA